MESRDLRAETSCALELRVQCGQGGVALRGCMASCVGVLRGVIFEALAHLSFSWSLVSILVL